MKTATIVWLALIILVGIGVLITASQALAIVWGVLILVAALTITGVLTSVYKKITGNV